MKECSFAPKLTKRINISIQEEVKISNLRKGKTIVRKKVQGKNKKPQNSYLDRYRARSRTKSRINYKKDEDKKYRNFS